MFVAVDYFIADFRFSFLLFLIVMLCSMAAFKFPRLLFNLCIHPPSIWKRQEYYRIFTGDLVHNDQRHLFFNLFMMWAFCIGLEDQLMKMGDRGQLQFLIIYIVSMLSGNLYIAIRHRNKQQYTSVGNSGSIMGCMFACMLLNPLTPLLYIPYVGGIPNIYSGLLYILFTLWRSKRKEKINFELHIAGALGGTIAALCLFPDILLEAL
ncbi:rhomboid family intramembrane serine protease [Mucilaginibacter gynuensis]|uniref:rhomboid family intramembrane serine protease n=1 Tax=Mucilaginibacter gynuensis TaxID=1302236 RepID=UPI0031E60AA8